jgi:hypothetical protein
MERGSCSKGTVRAAFGAFISNRIDALATPGTDEATIVR